ncbi:hypothetical protein OKW21_000574 [Catalinimonas alkaloidigena]|uniref:hypothetical protein n=1 Tax=Catalinimonas alkaloidigena TaxID=1075417 RepID=UPI0024054A88|nr:hypothetical protein [Catalinimonas alkaloidigena]MDF9795311.1 hypothetical protein [Catalinimonas alkaloidigena]
MLNRESKTNLNSILDILYNYAAKNGFRLILAVVLLGLMATVVLRIVLIFTFIPDLGGVESNVIYSIQRVMDGYPLYMDPSDPPYSITQYTPIYYFIIYALGKLFQISASDVESIYILSRSVSFIFNLGFAYLSALILVDIFKGKKWMGFIAFTFAFVFLDEESFSRPDSLYNVMVMATIYVFLLFFRKGVKPKKVSLLVLASLLSVFTIYVKQSGIFLPVLLVFFVLVYCQNIRWASISVATMLVSFTALLFLFTGGNLVPFFQNVVEGVNNGISLKWFVEKIVIEHFQKERFINIFGISLSIYWLVKGGSHQLKFLGLAMLGSFLFALITGVKVGAAPNYFTEFIALTVIATLIFLQKYDRLIYEEKTHHHDAPDNFKILFYLILVGMTLLPRLAGKVDTELIKAQPHILGKAGYQSNKAIADFMYEEEKIQPEDQVFITTHVHDYLNKFLYRNAIFPQKEIVYRNPEGVYDYNKFKQGLQNGDVKYIIASVAEGNIVTEGGEQVISEDFLSADYSDYKPIKELNGYVIFKSKSAP